ncbi:MULTISPECIES: ABC transporter ATP-binding protein [Candidatus Accumulibacter]|uniref:ABC-type multidrug transport system, ATPase component n=1 Tax=Candidatus Accumulibacter phosphatis TaxID=327160 RepID=A0A5S4ESK1_9PROT|nr:MULTISPECIES: ABC transporter ATP-binding protein [Candidatus Accumulibacter]MBL8400826.1 ABC transporter ATP-binding protein [Accumulibacter sp.]MCC2867508.1 ABC transporter ATP-binding protein [Candidatus Accumulibacter phosphatis]MCM8580330.1 ABC transporter ATP-binding protein [Accumulibacter sp.]MCM8620163.1 ABC transporter ATP-binding protein [Accumulibacter sp.]TMQ78510.1 ABC-type multidrug transport system, ATPase component [Candidatus Accumulibacter phosphatis]
MPVSVAVERVEKRFGSLVALAGVSLQISEGEFFGLLGPNGAGKTTLISCLAGLSRPSAGKLVVMGHDVVSDYRAARRLLGVVPQELVFDPFFTVRETLRIQSGYFGIRHNEGWIDEILANLDLTDKADTNMRRLSGGMKRRVLVAQALVHKPPVIVLDEPTAGVDVELRQGLWQFIRRLNRDGHTVILTTHYLEEAEALCGRIAMLKQGRVVALDTTSNLLARFAGHTLTLRLASAARLPSVLSARATQNEGMWTFHLGSLGEIEPLLAAMREAGCVIDDLRLTQADLEDVFLGVMQSSGYRKETVS